MNNNPKQNKNILFLGGLFPTELYDTLTNPALNGNIQNAANVLQWHIVNGMDNNLDYPVKILNAPYMGAYPKTARILRIKKILFCHKKNSDDINVGFLNIPFLRQFLILLNSRPHLKKWAKSNACGVALAYALTLRNVCELVYLKKVNPSVRTCVIVPDLPMYMRMTKSKIYTFLKSVEIRIIEKMLPKIDGFVLLTEAMNDFIKAKNYCVVEGIATESDLSAEYDNDKKIIFYSGALEEKYGVLNLLLAFEQIKDDGYQLCICGKGTCENQIRQMSQKDKRICFLGQIDRNEVVSIQKKSTVLVNPRQNTDDFTKYSFPSKNLEYLSSGVPLVAYKLDGIPKEYDDFIIYVEDNSVESLRDKLVEVCNYSCDKRKSIGLRSREFVLREKNETSQAKKIIDFVFEL